MKEEGSVFSKPGRLLPTRLFCLHREVCFAGGTRAAGVGSKRVLITRRVAKRHVAVPEENKPARQRGFAARFAGSAPATARNT